MLLMILGSRSIHPSDLTSPYLTSPDTPSPIPILILIQHVPFTPPLPPLYAPFKTNLMPAFPSLLSILVCIFPSFSLPHLTLGLTTKDSSPTLARLL